MKIKLIKDFAYSLKGYDYNLAREGETVELSEDLVRMAIETGAYKEEKEPRYDRNGKKK